MTSSDDSQGASALQRLAMKRSILNILRRLHLETRSALVALACEIRRLRKEDPEAARQTERDTLDVLKHSERYPAGR